MKGIAQNVVLAAIVSAIVSGIFQVVVLPQQQASQQKLLQEFAQQLNAPKLVYHVQTTPDVIKRSFFTGLGKPFAFDDFIRALDDISPEVQAIQTTVTIENTGKAAAKSVLVKIQSEGLPIKQVVLEPPYNRVTPEIAERGDVATLKIDNVFAGATVRARVSYQSANISSRTFPGTAGIFWGWSFNEGTLTLGAKVAPSIEAICENCLGQALQSQAASAR